MGEIVPLQEAIRVLTQALEKTPAWAHTATVHVKDLERVLEYLRATTNDRA